MRSRRLGSLGGTVGAIGLGCMGMSWGYEGGTRCDEEAGISVIRAAIDRGVTLIDTADVYGDGHNKRLVGRAILGRREQVTVATKVGMVVDDLATMATHPQGRPEHIRQAAHGSLRRLGIDVIDLYYLHRVDPDVPLQESWGCARRAGDRGKGAPARSLRGERRPGGAGAAHLPGVGCGVGDVAVDP